MNKTLSKFDLSGRINVVIGAHGLLGKIACETLSELGAEVIALDLPDFDVRHSLYDGPIPHGVINCAIGNQLACSTPQTGLQQDLEIGLFGAARMMELLKPRPGGTYVNVGSDLSFKAPDPYRYHPDFKPLSYSLVKHGIIGLTRYYAAIWGPQNIRANTLCPGSIDQGQPRPHAPLARLARADEMKAPIAFLMSEASSYMTGTELRVDGGSTCW